MTPEEAKKHVAERDAELAKLEAKVSRLAVMHAGPVMFAIIRGLVEMVCAAQGEIFRVHNKIRFYRGVLAMLRDKGIA